MKQTIYIRLLCEGTIVYRPVSAIKMRFNVFKVEGHDMYDPEDEEWEFVPGSLVMVERKTLSGGLVPVAIKSVEML